jgi:hypothetical protein
VRRKVLNEAAAVQLQLIQEGHAEVTPLEAMLQVLKARLERGDEAGILAAATAAAPYLHARLTQSDVTVRRDDLIGMTDADLTEEIMRIRSLQVAARSFDAVLVPQLEHADLRQPAGQASYTETPENTASAPAESPDHAE